jgi:hypothetical protein
MAVSSNHSTALGVRSPNAEWCEQIVEWGALRLGRRCVIPYVLSGIAVDGLARGFGW